MELSLGEEVRWIMDIKSKWKEIAIVLLILSNLFLMHSISRIRNDIYYLEGSISSLEGNLENLKNDVSEVESKADNNTSDIESIYGILQDMEHFRLFGFWITKAPTHTAVGVLTYSVNYHFQ